MRGLLASIGPAVTGLVACTWFLLAFKELPVRNGDYGMFISVAERLRAGDRLYVDVYENKDPLFHYTLALGRSVTPFAGWFLEIGWILVACIAAYALSRRLGLSARMSTLVGFVAGPIIITGAFYSPGLSHLPGIALTLAASAALLRGHPLAAGLLLGVLAGYKLIMLPVAVVIVAVLLVPGRRRSDALRVTAGLAGTLSLIAVLLAIRGEFVPYLGSIRSSASYAQDSQSASGVASILEHVSRVFTLNTQVTLLTIGIVILLVLGQRGLSTSRSSDSAGTPLTWALLASTIAAAGVLALTGLWLHHAQIFIVPSILAIALLASRGPASLAQAGAIPLAAVLGFAILLAGIPALGTYVSPVEYARSNIASQSSEPPEATLINSAGPPSSYARIGKGNDGGHAQGLEEWTLACPRFGQSDLDPTSVLNATLDCLPTARVILVATDAAPMPGVPAWNGFLEQVELLLAKGYDCRSESAGRICVRKSNLVTAG
jgi:hypothetical protein